MKQWMIGLLLAIVLAGGMTFAEDTPTLKEVMARLRDMEKTVKAQDERITEQSKRIGELKGELVLAKTLTAPAAATRDDVKALIREELMARPATGMPAWADGLKFGGDFRLRYEGIYGRKGLHPFALAADTYGRPRYGPSGLRARSPNDRSRFRYRLRFGFEKAITEELTMGFRLASGTGAATSTNETMGDSFMGDPIWIDQAYLKYKPSAVRGLTILGGKHPNNWDVAKTGILWDSDVQPEGLQVRYDHSFGETLSGWAQAEYFIIDESDAVLANGRWAEEVDALAYQVGAKADLSKGLSLTGALSYYDFMNMDDPNVLAAGNRGAWSGGNWIGRGSDPADRIVEDFDPIVADAILGFKVGDIPCAAFGQFIKNTKTSRGNSEDEAWAAGVKAGKIKQRRDWAAKVFYARVERDAVISGFGDADRYGSNYTGTVAKVSYGLFDNTELSGTIFCLDKLTGDSDSIVTTQLDLVVKF